MRITIERETTVKELLEEVEEGYGSKEEVEAYLEENPDDRAARLALHDINEYSDHDPGDRIKESRQIFLGDGHIDELTAHKLNILLALKHEDGTIEGVRALARQLGRDVKNVSQDVETLRRLGLLLVDEQGPGRPHILTLPGERITLHLMEPRRAEA